MAPGFELMGWLKLAGAQAGASTDVAFHVNAAPLAEQATGTAPVAAAPSRVAAPHSQAAAALAAAISAGGVPERKHPQPHGTPIAPHQEIIEVDRIRPDTASALVVSKIANFPSEICRRHGHSIAVDANYICYGLKAGQIRILNRHTAARTLLKDHAAPVTDLRFFRHDAERCLLASVDTAGQVHVRKVFEEDTDGEEYVRDEILAQHVLPISTSGPAAHPPARLAWHPNYDFVLAVAAGPTVYLINVPPTADVAATPEYLGPVAAAHSADGAVMTSVSFSPLGDLLAAGDARGFVYVWALTPEQLDPALIQPLAAEPDIRFQAYGSAPGEAPYGDGSSDSAAVTSLSWLLQPGSGESSGSREGSGAVTPLVLLTGDGVNAHLRLWTIDLFSKPQCTHAICLTSATGGAQTSASQAFFNHLEVQPLYDCVILANEVRNHVYVLHLDLESQPDVPTFDYVTEFSVKMPILSCTLVPEVFEDEATGAEAFHMYTMQSDAVQQYTLVPGQCFPIALLPGNVGTNSLGGSGTVAAGTSGGHHPYYHAVGSGHVGGNTASSTSDAAAAARLSKDPLAALLALQQVQQQQQGKGTELPVAPARDSTLPMGQGNLVEMPSDMSDATSPLVTAGSAAMAPAGEQRPDSDVGGDTVSEARGQDEALGGGAALEAVTDASEALEAAMAADASTVPQPSAIVRPTLLLTPSQLMQSAAAAAATARSVASSSASTLAPVLSPAQQENLCGTTAAPSVDNDTMVSTAGTSRSHSITTVSNVMTPSASDANLADVAAAEVADAEKGDAVAAATRADLEEGDVVTAAADVKALPTGTSSSVPLPQQQSQSSLPPQSTELFVSRVSQGRDSPAQPSPTAAVQRRQPALPPSAPSASGGTTPTSATTTSSPQQQTAAPAPVAAVYNGEEMCVDAVAAVPVSTSHMSASLWSDVQAQQQQQQALMQLLALQQHLLDQVSTGQRELMKVVRAEAQRSSKIAADSAATRAAEAVARRAAEERRKETAELQKAITGAINHATRDLSQRVADAAAATTAAVKAAIGPAVRAAVAEALPAALSSGGTAAALERALGSQLATALPRAVADGLGATFTAQVVPPLERATSTMFGQIESALRVGLDTHLAPLEPLSNLGSQLREITAQVQAAAKSLKNEAAAMAQQAAAAASRAAAAAAAAAVSTQPPIATAVSLSSAPIPTAPISGGGTVKGSAKLTAPTQVVTSNAPGSSTSLATETSSMAAAGAAASRSTQIALRSQPTATQAAVAVGPSGPRPEFAPGCPAAPAASAVTTVSVAAQVSSPPHGLDPATKAIVLGLICGGNLDDALSRMLERQDLALVLWACAEAGGATILGREPCPFSQPTLLSLLTFLSYDLTADVDLKLGWIDAILKRLDVKEPGLAPHIRGVLDSVKAALAVIARRGTDATAAKAKQAVHQAIGLIAMLS